jgi:probable phosphoglycerate mutase
MVPPVSESREFRQSRFVTPAGGCELLLVRHGESAPYVEGTLHPMVDGQGDPPLHDEGRVQAELVAERLISSGERIDAIYVTTMRRTLETAAPLASKLGLKPVVEPLLREVHLGEWEGGEFRRRVAEGDPISRRLLAEQRWDVIPGAESIEEFSNRVRTGIDAVAASHPDEVVVVVTHGGVIGQVLALATGAAPLAFSGADNASITHIVVANGHWHVRCFNDTSHLSPTFTTASEPFD